MTTLKLGHTDLGKKPKDRKKFLTKFHNVGGISKGTSSFIEDDQGKWRRFKELKDVQVKPLQAFLLEAGFMPTSEKSGIFGYATQGAVRLFQEYVRSIEGKIGMIPDGYVGPATKREIVRWESNDLKSRWGGQSSTPSAEYSKWINFLNKAKDHSIVQQHQSTHDTIAFAKANDSIVNSKWAYSTSDIHLIGIRVGEDKRVMTRANDDLFILLIDGMVFKFWGSTDPSQSIDGRIPNEAFLAEGQHKYKLAWHKLSHIKKIYRALRPYGQGVLVYRDWNNDNALTQEDVNVGLDLKPNPTINIHWSGKGSTNFSIGCQVIAGESYINDQGEVIDCGGYAAHNSKDLKASISKTKGAYNVISDLLISYSAFGTDHIYYTLLRDEVLDIDATIGKVYAKNTVDRMKNEISPPRSR